MNDAGDILVRRYAKSNVYIKSTTAASEEKETAIGADVLKQPNQSLEIEKVYKVSFWRGMLQPEKETVSNGFDGFVTELILINSKWLQVV